MRITPRRVAWRAACLLLAPFSILAQDRVRDAREPILPSIDVAALTYDYLVDGSLAQDEPEHKRFKTVQAAYAAAPAGTAAKPTVIGLKPDVYFLRGGATTPGLLVEKPYITLLGLTNNRRSVVLADNRGNKQGGGDAAIAYNGYVLIVNADGFTLRNLTVLNYCNNDYEYPGDPAKNLKKRSDVITQAVAADLSGDKHAYLNVAFLSRLDTIFLKTTRSYFKDVYIEGTNDFIGGGTISVWEDCVVDFPEGTGLPFATNIAFINTRFTAARGFAMYKNNGAARPVALINCTVPPNTPDAPIGWTRGEAPGRPNYYSLTYRLKDPSGKPVKIWDGTARDSLTLQFSRELSDDEVRAFNPWNLLRATPTGVADDWDPAGAKAKYEAAGAGSLVYRLALTNPNASIRAGAAGVTIGATVSPVRVADKTIRWSTPSGAVALSTTSGPSVVVTGNPKLEQPEYVPITATASNGHCATAWVFVEPAYLAAPAIVGSLKLSPPARGAVTLDYQLALAGNEDQSLVTWFSCDDAAGTHARRVAVSRGNEPLKSYALTPGDVGRYLKASIQPKHNRSDPGPAVAIVAAKPVTAADLDLAVVAPNFRNFVTDVNDSFVSGRWTVLGTWTAPSGTRFVNGYGVRFGSQGAALLYQNDDDVGDMQLDLVLTPEKPGNVFGSPGTGADGARDQKCDVYIKYDPRAKTGYALRFWRAVDQADKCIFQLVRIVNGAASPVSGRKIVTGVVKPNLHLTIKVSGEKFSATARNDRDDESLALEESVAPSRSGGAGVYWSGTTHEGNSATVSQFRITYPKAEAR